MSILKGSSFLKNSEAQVYLLCLMPHYRYEYTVAIFQYTHCGFCGNTVCQMLVLCQLSTEYPFMVQMVILSTQGVEGGRINLMQKNLRFVIKEIYLRLLCC